MSELWTSIAVFTLFHALPSTRVRPWFIGRYGRGMFMLAYSIVSSVLFVWLFIAFWRAEYDSAWFTTSRNMRLVSAGVMFVAFQLLAAALLRSPPILLTAETALARADAVRGILRITRHPFMWALALWSMVHIVNNADPAGFALFGYFLLLAILGTWPIDRRRARLLGRDKLDEICRQTSNIPFAAIIAGKQNLPAALREIGWRAPLAGLVLWAFILHFHESFFGQPVFY
jgi:uncharacterized membrane protein